MVQLTTYRFGSSFLTRGVIAAGDARTAEAGAAILRDGGNAVDAAVAASFASFVTETTVVNIGGGGYATVVAPRTSQANGRLVYDFFSTMPSGDPHPDMDFREVLIDFGPETQSFFIGRASTAVPGVVAGLCQMASDWGRLPLKKLLEPAIRYAEEGFPMPANMAALLDVLQPIFSDSRSLENLFWNKETVKTEGDLVRFPELGRTLRRLAAQGPELFYRGELARAICDDQRRHGGLITPQDLDTYCVNQIAPLEATYRGYTIMLPPPPSQGGVLIAFSLALLETFNPAEWSASESEYLLILANVMRTTHLARLEWDRHSAAIDSPFLAPENIGHWRMRLLEALEGFREGKVPPAKKSPGNTTHLSVVDTEGLAVSITTSAGETAGYLVGDSGVCLNNVLGEHDLNPHGFHVHPPGSRLTSMMSPVIVLKDEKPVLVLGSAGSNRLRSAIVQTIANWIDFGLPIDTAINRPRIHYEDGLLQLEGGTSDTAADTLSRAGFKLNRWQAKNFFFGGAQAVACLDGNMTGGADTRRMGAVRYAR